MNETSLIKEGKEIEQELKALHKRLKAETKELKKRYRAHVKSVDKFCDKNTEDTDLCLKVGARFNRCESALYYIPEVFEGWDGFWLTCPPKTSTLLSVMNTKEQLAQIFFNILEKQSFEHWHSNHFQDYITGEENAPSKAEILKELEWQVSRELNLRWAVQLKPLHSYL